MTWLQPKSILYPLSSILVFSLLAGCVTVEPGFRYDFDGRVFRKDGKTPVKGAEIWVARPDAPPPPELPEKMEKMAVRYTDRSTKNRTDSQGRFVGNLQTVKGWKYTEFNGMHVSGPTQAPLPPEIEKVYVYVSEKGSKPVGYELVVPKEFQAEAISGVRKLHLPDLWIWDKPSTQPTTEESEKE